MFLSKSLSLPPLRHNSSSFLTVFGRDLMYDFIAFARFYPPISSASLKLYQPLFELLRFRSPLGPQASRRFTTDPIDAEIANIPPVFEGLGSSSLPQEIYGWCMRNVCVPLSFHPLPSTQGTLFGPPFFIFSPLRVYTTSLPVWMMCLHFFSIPDPTEIAPRPSTREVFPFTCFFRKRRLALASVLRIFLPHTPL